MSATGDQVLSRADGKSDPFWGCSFHLGSRGGLETCGARLAVPQEALADLPARILGAQIGRDAGLGTEAGRKERTRSPRLQTKSSLGQRKALFSNDLGHRESDALFVFAPEESTDASWNVTESPDSRP
jgi:hypothetical protein